MKQENSKRAAYTLEYKLEAVRLVQGVHPSSLINTLSDVYETWDAPNLCS